MPKLEIDEGIRNLLKDTLMPFNPTHNELGRIGLVETLYYIPESLDGISESLDRIAASLDRLADAIKERD